MSVKSQPHRLERVPRVVPRSYSSLPPEQANEHRDWQLRQRSKLADGRVSGDVDEDIDVVIDVVAAELLAITSLLADRYGTPDLGHKIDPVDELVYIILSRRTREDAYQAAYRALRSRFAHWEELAFAPVETIEEVIRSSGLGCRKAQSLKLALLVVMDRFGSCTLEPTRSWDDDQVLEFLCSLPEVGPKSAACVMMCALDRPAFPVDAHVGRVLERLDTLHAARIELRGTNHKVKQALLWDAIPPSIRFSLHVNALVHGRRICIPRRPRCERCVLAARCQYLRERKFVSEGSGRPAD